MSAESRAAFFRQSGWMVMATTLSGVFLVAVYSVLHKMPIDEVGIFMSLLRLFAVLAIPAAGLQVVMAQEAAAAITQEQKQELAVASRSVLRGIFMLWCVIAVVCFIYRREIIMALKISNPLALWTTLGLVLAALCLPLMQGLLQGMQNFTWLGWSVMLNGVGRFVGVVFAVIFFKAHSAGALFGAFVGMGAAVLVGFWPSRELFKSVPGSVNWRRWLGRLVPLTFGVGSSLFLMNADVLFVQSHFPSEIASFYSAVAVLGVGLVAFTGPMSAVMFPKLVKSFAQSQKSDSLILALAGTALLSAIGAAFCTLFPELPLRILLFKKPELWISSQLVPGFIWAMVPLTVANVLINNLMARERFGAVPWFVATAVGYGFVLNAFLAASKALPHFDVFKGVVWRLGGFSLLLLLVALVFTMLDFKKTARS